MPLTAECASAQPPEPSRCGLVLPVLASHSDAHRVMKWTSPRLLGLLAFVMPLPLWYGRLLLGNPATQWYLRKPSLVSVSLRSVDHFLHPRVSLRCGDALSFVPGHSGWESRALPTLGGRGKKSFLVPSHYQLPVSL